jgi:hypothetical protein
MQSMPQSQRNTVYPVPQAILEKLSQLRGLIARFVLSQALIAVALWLVAAFWGFGLCDYLPTQFGAAESPKMVRVVMLIVLATVALYILYRFLWQLWLVRWTDSSLALLIENKYQAFQSSLVTTVQASKTPAEVPYENKEHPQRAGLLEIARDQAVQLIDSVDISRIVRFRPMQLQLASLAVLMASSAIILLSQPNWTLHWAKRFFGLSNAPWPRYTLLGVDGIEMDIPTFTGRAIRQRYTLPFTEGTVLVPKGQSCQLKTWASLAAKMVPEVCTVFYRDSAGNRGRANMRRLPADKKQQPFVLDGPPLESISDSLWLSVAGGDSRIANLQLQSVEPPIVTQLTLNLEYPEYLQRSTKTKFGKESLVYRTGTRIPQGSQVSLAIEANKAIRRVDYLLVRSGDPSEQKDAPEKSVDIASDQSNQFTIPLGMLNGNVMMEFRLWDTNGICSTRVQQFVISAIADQPPQVDLVLDGIGTAVTENAVLPVNGKVKDDYDVKRAWLETVLDNSPSEKSAITVENDGKANSQLDLKAARDLGKLLAKAGSTLGLTLVAEDYADLADGAHVGRANPIQLNVVTPDQLLILLERRELAMRARLEQIIGELSQMRDLVLIIQKAEASVAADPNPAAKSDQSNAEENNSDQSAVSTESSDPDTVTDTAEKAETKRARMQMLRSQQVAAQLTKSEGELLGVEKEIHQITRELINNRVDSQDRRTRLEDKIRGPLLQVLDSMWKPFATDVLAIEKNYTRSRSSDVDLALLIPKVIEQNNQVIAALNEILSDMIDIQDFNELIDMVRGMLDDQGKVIEKTKQEKKRQELELLK